ncbi:hypothetical protein K439DRAFT_1638744 [Ramaria rubella]|nr:hypothetical protein K439DRAFT_1638744 [Ramaria rubella]
MALARQVEELVLLKCSLLPDEILDFITPHLSELEAWTEVIEAHSKGKMLSSQVSCPASFTVKLRGSPLWFEIQFLNEYPVQTQDFNIAIRGYNISKAEQKRWQDRAQDKRAQLIEAEFPAYELLSLHLLPLLREECDAQREAQVKESNTSTKDDILEPIFHALLTSHHLKSPQKRRSLQLWSSELHLNGFVKVGHPGVIYCSGVKSDVEEFVKRVRSMQWLALRVRFVEGVPDTHAAEMGRNPWKEVEKIGEAIEEMRKLGRERFFLDLGIGSRGTSKAEISL